MTISRKQVFTYFILALGVILIFIRAFYGFVWSDEPFYLSTANRFTQGDVPIRDEWSIAQLYAILLVPFVKVYKSVIGSNEGIMLGLRFLYCGMQTVLCCVVYWIIKKYYDPFTASASSLIAMMYARGGIITLSYYSLFTFCAVLSQLLFFFWWTRKKMSNKGSDGKGDLLLVIIGLSEGIASICSPYSVLFWGSMYIILMIGHRKFQIMIRQISMVIISFSIPIVIEGIYILRYQTLWQIIKNTSLFYSISGGDAGKAYSYSVVYKALKLIISVAHAYKVTVIPLFVLALSLFSFLLKNNPLKNTLQSIYMCLFTIILIINIFAVQTNWDVTGQVTAALTVYGLFVFLLTRFKKMTVFWLIYLPGIVLALLSGLSSDTGLSAMTQGFVLSSMATILFCKDYVKELLPSEKYYLQQKFLICFGLFLAIVSFAVQRFSYVYRDESIGKLKYVIQDGPGKGIITSKECFERYNGVYRVISEINNDGSVLILPFAPWAYLCTEMSCAYYTTWKAYPEKLDDYSKLYYSSHKDKYPNTILLLDVDYYDFDEQTVWALENDTLESLNDELKTKYNDAYVDSSFFENVRNEYDSTSVECGIVYEQN